MPDGRSIRAASALCVAALAALVGCVDEERPEWCPDSLDVGFYSQTPCAEEPSYPDVTDVRLYLFDSDGLFVSEVGDAGMTLSSEYVLSTGVPSEARTLAAWAGLESGPFEIEQPEKGVTTLDEMAFRANLVGGQIANMRGAEVWFGQKRIDSGAFSAEIDLREITDRLAVQVSGLPAAGNYEVTVDDSPAAMSYSGGPMGAPVTLSADFSEIRETGFHTSFTLLDVADSESDVLVVRNADTGEVLYRENLLAGLLQKNPFLELDCVSDFEIEIEMGRESGTWMAVSVTVNGWVVYGYGKDM